MEQENVCRGQVRRVGRVGKQLDLFMGQELLGFLGGVHQSIVAVEYPVTRAKIRPLLIKNFEELLQGADDIIHIHCGVPGHVVCVNHPLVVEEDKHHLLRAARNDFGPNGAWCTIF